ncbi:MAG: acyl carrier protein [Actinomycetota bacterium]
MDQDLFNRFVKCAVDTLSVDAGRVVPDARFKEDLEADSLDVVELMMAIEEEFGIEQIPEEELAEVTTVGQAFAIIASKL